MIEQFNINELIPLFTIGVLFSSAVYHSNLYLFNRSKFLANYSLYLWLSFLFVLLACTTLAESKEDSDPLAYLLVIIIIWSSFYVYFKFLFNSLQASALNNTLAYQISKYFWVSIPLHLFFYFSSSITPLTWKHIILNIGNATNLIGLLCGIYILLTILKYYNNNKSKVDIRFFKYIIWGGLTMLISNVFSDSTEIVRGNIFSLSQLSFICIGYFIEVIFFSFVISFKMKIDSKEKYLALKKVNIQETLIEKQRIQAHEILLNQDINLQKRVTKTIIDQRAIFGRKLHDDITGSLIALKYLVNDFKISNDALSVLNKFDLIEKEIEIIYSDTRNYSHQLINNFETADNYKYDIKTYLDKLKTQFNELNLVKVHFTVDEEGLNRLDNFKTNYLYYCIKECFSNVLKHSKSENIWISISFVKQECRLSFKDDGCGNHKTNNHGLGLKNIIENVENLKGTYILKTNSGTEINIFFPI